jgi:hypothetical protein
MGNLKCLLCHDIITPYHKFIYVICKCGSLKAGLGGIFTPPGYTVQNPLYVSVDDDGNEYKENNEE